MNIDEYVIVNKKFMEIVGLYPINLLRYFICISLIFLILVPQMFQYYLRRHDFSAILETRWAFVSKVLSDFLSFFNFLNLWKFYQFFIGIFFLEIRNYVAQCRWRY